MIFLHLNGNADSSGRVDCADYLKSHLLQALDPERFFVEQGRFSYTSLSYKDRGLIGQKGQEFN